MSLRYAYKIRNWEKYQHYSKRNPPWIKLHYETLQSEDWVMLDNASRVLAIACMLIASRHEGNIPADSDYMTRVAYLNEPPNYKPLIRVGFLETLADASKLQADARPETETETETEIHDLSLCSRSTMGVESCDDPDLSPSLLSTDVVMIPTDPKSTSKTRQRNDYPPDFQEFWSVWSGLVPKRINAKGDAFKAWKQTKKDRPSIDVLREAIEQQSQTEQWRKDGGQFIPYPAKWLRQGRWDDEVEPEGAAYREINEELDALIEQERERNDTD